MMNEWNPPWSRVRECHNHSMNAVFVRQKRMDIYYHLMNGIALSLVYTNLICYGLWLLMEIRSCARGRQWCGIIHYY